MLSSYSALAASLGSIFAYAVSAQASGTARILLYTATADYRHDSIPTAVEALQQKASSINVQFDHTEDRTVFADENLANYDALLFLSTSGQVLDDTGTAAMQKYLNLGGNFIGIHSASFTLESTPFYVEELGAWFDYHPALQNATIDVIGPSHPSTVVLPAQWHVQDEIYNFKSDPRSIGAVVILSADESSYVDDGTRQFNQGTPHPIAWFQEHGAGIQPGGIAGRSFYTSLGHLNETWQDDLFMAHVTAGITWTLQSNTTRAFNASASVGNAASSSLSTSAGSSVSASGSAGGVSSLPSDTSSLGPATAASTWELLRANPSVALVLSVIIICLSAIAFR